MRHEFLLLILLSLSACAFPQKCVNGKLYKQEDPGAPYTKVYRYYDGMTHDVDCVEPGQ